ncbi:MAG TPA: alkaline phosphatase family protein [Actinomycetota bacterium]|nr:alkaline phosphatase family protein [Actinomycetota bacterium]
MAPRLVVLGWDSATFDVIDPLVERGRLPALAGLARDGFRARLRSSWPPMTDCAWTCAFTGANPGAHGIYGSWYRAPGAYACRLFSSRDRIAPALWEMADDARFAVWNVPMTYPPTSVQGAMVAGYGAPPGTRFCAPDGLQEELAERWPLEDLLDRAPHGSLETFLDDLVRGLRAQSEAIVWLAGRVEADCVIAVWPQIDRAQHFFWRFRGTDHPLAGAVDAVYEAADRATAAVVEAFDGADVVVVSDHGAGPLGGDVNVGAWLARRGLARHGASPRPRLLDLAWALPPRARRAAKRLAPGAARRAFGATLAGQLGPFEWGATKAFMGFHGDLWLNLRSREPEGIVEEAEAPALLEELGAALRALADPRTGAPLFAATMARDEIYSGPAAGLGADMMLDSWSAGYRVAPGRRDSGEIVTTPAPLPGVREAWSSDHRPEGVFVAAGPRIARGAATTLSLVDVCPTCVALLEAAVPAGLDGAVAEAALDPAFLARHPVRTDAARTRAPAAGDLPEDEAAAVASHLRDLGYIE